MVIASEAKQSLLAYILEITGLLPPSVAGYCGGRVVALFLAMTQTVTFYVIIKIYNQRE